MPDVWESVFHPTLAAWGISLSTAQEESFQRYARYVLEKNRSFNLTAAGDEAEIVRRHLLDGLAALPHVRAKLMAETPTLADVGSGAGFIGLSLKIGWPQLQVTLVESVRKKAAFMEWVGDKLGLAGLKVVADRAEPLALSGARFDGVIERALAPLPEAVGFCLPLAKPGGHFFAFQTEAPSPNAEAWKTMSALGGQLEETFRYRLPGEDQNRSLLCLLKS